MEICLEASWETFAATARQSKKGIYLFGASSTGRMFLEQVAEKFRICGILDNDTGKWGEVWQVSGKEITVQGIQVLETSEKEDIVLIASTWYLDILKQMEAFGYQGKVFSFLSMRKVLGGGSLKRSICEFEEHFDEVKDLLADEESVRILQAVLKKRKNAELDYSDIKSGSAYFLPDLIRRRKDAVYVDAGAYNGDTVKAFADFQNQEYKKVFAFEMDRKNYEAIDMCCFDDRVHFYPFGLWSEKRTFSFLSSEMASSLSEIGSQSAQVITLDEVVKEEPVTLIKMDIEGAEKEALKGAEATIRREKPDLAICVYHKPEDIWQIPLLLADMVSGYKLYLRHHGDTIMDTVLYAIGQI